MPHLRNSNFTALRFLSPDSMARLVFVAKKGEFPRDVKSHDLHLDVAAQTIEDRLLRDAGVEFGTQRLLRRDHVDGKTLLYLAELLKVTHAGTLPPITPGNRSPRFHGKIGDDTILIPLTFVGAAEE
jgi:hypothetical protein